MKNFLIGTTFFVLLVLMGKAATAATSSTNLVGIGQGISSPTLTTTINFGSGFTSENPLGVIYQKGGRATLEYDKNGSSRTGAELGYGKENSWGLAAGYNKRECGACEGNAAGAVGVAISDIGFGLRFAEELYSVGLIFNTSGQHRVGIVAELNDVEGTANDVKAFGVGYSFVGQQFTFTIDASKFELENAGQADDFYLVTPGLMVRVDIIQITLNDRISIDKTGSNATDDHDTWFGIGIGGDTWHLAGYSDYVNEIALAGTYFF